MKKLISLSTHILTICLLSHCIYGQSSQSFLKAIPNIDQTTPDWAKEMYKENPDIIKVDELYQTYFTQHIYSKTVHTQNYKHWRRAVEPFLDESGFVKTKSIEAQNKLQKTRAAKRQANNRSSNLWSAIGPFDTYSTDQDQVQVSWQGNIYSIDQSSSDPNVLFVGTEAGGIYKTLDKGITWSHASFDSEIAAVSSVKIDPSNSDVVFAGDGRRIYKTNNGGDSWDVMLEMDNMNINDFSINPDNTNEILAAANQGLLRSVDGGVNWDNVLEDKIWDIERKTDNPNIVYVLKSNPSESKSEFWKSTNGGSTFTIKSNGWYNSTDPNRSEGGGRMTVTPADPNRIYVILIGQAKEGDNGFIGVYRSNNAGEAWDITDPPIGGPYDVDEHPNLATINRDGSGFHQGYYNLGIAASHTNADDLLIGFLNLWRTNDGGNSFTPLGGYQGNVGWIHPDQQELEINGGDMWLANDGGINYSTDLFDTHESRKYGMLASDFWGFGSAWNEDLVVGGRYHNGNTAYRPSFEEGRFLRLGGGEAATGYVAPGGESLAYFSDISAKRIPQNLTDAVENVPSFSSYPSESFYAAHYSELEFDPNCYSHVIIGKENKLWRSENNGNSFDLVYEFGTDAGAPLMQFEISRADNEVMYAYQRTSFYGAVLWVTQDGGNTWVQRSFPTGAGSMRAGVLQIHSEEPGSLWVAFAHQNNDGNKLYRTNDFGETWENISDPILDGESIHAIFHHAGTDSDLYIGTNYNMYYFDGTSWSLCNNGLPGRFSVNRFMPFYKENKLRVATYSSGIWETTLVKPTKPLAQATVDKRTSRCVRDTFYFDDYSSVEHENISWSWTFEPEPIYISNANTRNPKVVFGSTGSYSVKLVVTNDQGSDTFSKEGFIELMENACEPDIYPDKSAICYGSGNDYIQTGNLGLSTDYFTIMAWIKPEGIQPDYTGIIFNDGEGIGLNFTTNNQLGFHYEGQGSAAWAWNSGLFVEPGVWSHVAMVVTPEGVRLYLNGEYVDRPLTLDRATFSSLKMGSYRGWTSRNYSGEFDEVSIWSRALDFREVQLYRHLVRSSEDIGLFAYYQFNETDGEVLDRIGLIHANIAGGAERTISYAPVGTGVSELRQGSPNGDIYLNEVGLVVSGASLNDDNTFIGTRIDLAPQILDVDDAYPINTYYILNFYGEFELNKIWFRNQDFEPYYNDAPEEIILYTRSENEGTGVWNEIGPAFSASTETQGEIKFNYNYTTGKQFIMSKPLISGIKIIDEGTSVDLFPNPTSQSIHVTSEVNWHQIKLFDSKGNLVLSQQIVPKTSISIPKTIKSGVYSYILESDKKFKTGQLVIVN